MIFKRCLTTIGLTSSLVVASLFPIATHAESFESLRNLDQRTFEMLARNLSAATHYKGVIPAESLGVLGLDVGFELSTTEIDQDVFDLASDGSFEADALVLPRIHAHKGLPFGLDVGAFLSAIPDTDLSVVGAELRLSLARGSILKPAIALRGSYSQIQGIADFELNNTALELTISKGFLFFTPYGGVGVVRTNAEANFGNLEDENFTQEKMFIGATLNAGLGLTVEADRTGDFTTFSAKFGLRF